MTGKIDGCKEEIANLCFDGGGGLFLNSFDLLPVAQDRIGVGSLHACKDMGMAANELCVEIGRYIVDSEVACFGGHLRVEEHLQQEIAELILQIGPRAALNGVEDLVGLLQGVAFDGVEGLFAIPGTALWRAKTTHNRNGFRQRFRVGSSGGGRFWGGHG